MQEYLPLAYLMVGAVSWLVMFLGTRIVMPQFRKLPDAAQAMLALFVAAAVSSIGTHYGIILPDGAIVSADNIAAILTAWLTAMGTHTAVKPAESVVATAVHGPSEGVPRKAA